MMLTTGAGLIYLLVMLEFFEATSAAPYYELASYAVAGGPPTVLGMRGKRVLAFQRELSNDPENAEEQAALPMEANYPYGAEAVESEAYGNERPHERDLLPYGSILRRRQRFQRPPAYVYYFV